MSTLPCHKYDSVVEAQQRLEGTIVRYDGEPVFVSGVLQPEDTADGVARVYIKPLPLYRTQRGTRKFLKSKRFDGKPIPLGYMNLADGGGVLYLDRSPARQYRQGLSADTLIISYPPNIRTGYEKQYTLSDLLLQREFVEMVHGDYPTWSHATNKLQREVVDSIALSRSVAIIASQEVDGLFTLHYNNTPVGAFASSLSDGVTLSRFFTFLREELSELGVPIREREQ